MNELIFKEKVGEFYTSPNQLSNEDKEIQYLIEINNQPLLLIIGRTNFLFHGKIINKYYKPFSFLIIKTDKDFDHTDINIMKKYSDSIFDEMKKQIKDIDQMINGD